MRVTSVKTLKAALTDIEGNFQSIKGLQANPSALAEIKQQIAAIKTKLTNTTTDDQLDQTLSSLKSTLTEIGKKIASLPSNHQQTDNIRVLYDNLSTIGDRLLGTNNPLQQPKKQDDTNKAIDEAIEKITKGITTAYLENELNQLTRADQPEDYFALDTLLSNLNANLSPIYKASNPEKITPENLLAFIEGKYTVQLTEAAREFLEKQKAIREYVQIITRTITRYPVLNKEIGALHKIITTETTDELYIHKTKVTDKLKEINNVLATLYTQAKEEDKEEIRETYQKFFNIGKILTGVRNPFSNTEQENFDDIVDRINKGLTNAELKAALDTCVKKQKSNDYFALGNLIKKLNEEVPTALKEKLTKEIITAENIKAFIDTHFPSLSEQATEIENSQRRIRSLIQTEMPQDQLSQKISSIMENIAKKNIEEAFNQLVQLGSYLEENLAQFFPENKSRNYEQYINLIKNVYPDLPIPVSPEQKEGVELILLCISKMGTGIADKYVMSTSEIDKSFGQEILRIKALSFNAMSVINKLAPNVPESQRQQTDDETEMMEQEASDFISTKLNPSDSSSILMHVIADRQKSRSEQSSLSLYDFLIKVSNDLNVAGDNAAVIRAKHQFNRADASIPNHPELRTQEQCDAILSKIKDTKDDYLSLSDFIKIVTNNLNVAEDSAVVLRAKHEFNTADACIPSHSELRTQEQCNAILSEIKATKDDYLSLCEFQNLVLNRFAPDNKMNSKIIGIATEKFNAMLQGKEIKILKYSDCTEIINKLEDPEAHSQKTLDNSDVDEIFQASTVLSDHDKYKEKVLVRYTDKDNNEQYTSDANEISFLTELPELNKKLTAAYNAIVNIHAKNQRLAKLKEQIDTPEAHNSKADSPSSQDSPSNGDTNSNLDSPLLSRETESQNEADSSQALAPPQKSLETIKREYVNLLTEVEQDSKDLQQNLYRISEALTGAQIDTRNPHTLNEDELISLCNQVAEAYHRKTETLKSSPYTPSIDAEGADGFDITDDFDSTQKATTASPNNLTTLNITGTPIKLTFKYHQESDGKITIIHPTTNYVYPDRRTDIDPEGHKRTRTERKIAEEKLENDDERTREALIAQGKAISEQFTGNKLTHIIPEVHKGLTDTRQHIQLRVVNAGDGEFNTKYNDDTTSELIDPRRIGLSAQNKLDDTNCGRYVAAMTIQAAGLAADGIQLTRKNVTAYLKESPAVRRALHFNNVEDAKLGMRNAYVRPLITYAQPNDPRNKVIHATQTLNCLLAEYESRKKNTTRAYHGTKVKPFGEGYGTATRLTTFFGKALPTSIRPYSASEKYAAATLLNNLIGQKMVIQDPSKLRKEYPALSQGELGKCFDEYVSAKANQLKSIGKVSSAATHNRSG